MKNGLLIILFLISISSFAEPPEFINECMDCHGEKGVSLESDIPTIAGSSEVFLEDAIYAYQEGIRPASESKYRTGDLNRPATDMKKIADELTTEQIKELSSYFSALLFVPAEQNFNSDLASIGKKIHAKRCEKCHENGGSSPEDDAGILSGQWTDYLRTAFKNIINDRRETDKKMKKSIKKLSKKDIEALLQFYASNK